MSYLGLIDAAYTHAGDDDDSWVHALAEKAKEISGETCAVYLVHPGRVGRDRLGAISGRGAWRPILEQAVAVHAEAPAELAEALYSGGPFAELASERARAADVSADMTAALRPWGARDVLGIYGGSSAGGCMITLPATGRPLAPRTRWMLHRVAVHVAAAYRLRLAGLPEADASFDADGHLLGGRLDDDVAPQTVASIARAVDGAEHRSADRALRVWQGLVEGRWSIVRSQDARGRRLLLLRKNEIEEARGDTPRARRKASVLALAARGHSNKIIAYELGIPISTVADDLRAGLAAIGVANRAELVRVLGRGGGVP